MKAHPSLLWLLPSLFCLGCPGGQPGNELPPTTAPAAPAGAAAAHRMAVTVRALDPAAVKAALKGEAGLEKVTYEVTEIDVILRGTVATTALKRQAGKVVTEAITKAQNSRVVTNKIEVKP